MSTSRKTTALALAGGVALASVAYGIGSQSADGSAGAAASNRGANTAPAGFIGRGGPGRGGGFGLDALAEDLGVSASALRTALEDVRGDLPQPEDRKADMAAALATALGVSTEKVTAALEGLHDDRHAGLAAALAQELGLGAAKVEAAIEKVHEDRDGRRGRRADAAALAKELGVTRAKLRAAFGAIRDEMGPRDRDHGERHAELAAELAAALDLDEAKVEAALEQLREDHEAEHAKVTRPSPPRSRSG